MDDDPTQTPPFHPVAVVEAGVVTAFAGQANDFWFANHAAANHVAAPAEVRVGDLYDGKTFTRPAPETLPTTDEPEVTPND